MTSDVAIPTPLREGRPMIFSGRIRLGMGRLLVVCIVVSAAIAIVAAKSQPTATRRDAVARAVAAGASLDAIREMGGSASLTEQYDWSSSYGDPIDDLRWQGLTPLHIAVRLGRVDVATALIAGGVSVNIRSEYGSTPLMVALEYGASRCVRLLLDSKDVDVAAIDARGCSAIHYAAKYASIEVLIELSRAPCDFQRRNNSGSSALMYAAWSQDAHRVIPFLIEMGLSARTTSYTGSGPLHSAVRADNLTAARLLVGARARIEGADAKDQLRRPIHIAAASASPGSADMVAFLLQSGADPDSRSAHGVTPLMEACRSGTLRTVCILVDAGADIEALDTLHQTALFYAVRNRRWEAAEFLVEAGANIKGEGAGDTLNDVIRKQRLQEPDLMESERRAQDRILSGISRTTTDR